MFNYFQNLLIFYSLFSANLQKIIVLFKSFFFYKDLLCKNIKLLPPETINILTAWHRSLCLPYLRTHKIFCLVNGKKKPRSTNQSEIQPANILDLEGFSEIQL